MSQFCLMVSSHAKSLGFWEVQVYINMTFISSAAQRNFICSVSEMTEKRTFFGLHAIAPAHWQLQEENNAHLVYRTQHSNHNALCHSPQPPWFCEGILTGSTEEQIGKTEANLKHHCVSAWWGKLAISKVTIVEIKWSMCTADVFLLLLFSFFYMQIRTTGGQGLGNPFQKMHDHAEQGCNIVPFKPDMTWLFTFMRLTHSILRMK